MDKFVVRRYFYTVLFSTCISYSFVFKEYEDEIQPYLDVTKSVYKELVSVQKDSETQTIRVVSPVFQIEALVNR